MTSSVTMGTGSRSVTMVTDSEGTDPSLDVDLRASCNRVKVLEQNEVSTLQSGSYLRNRIRELEKSERSLLLQLYQLASASHLPSMQHSQRLDQRLHMLREEVRTMTQEKEKGERVWRERLQRCQRQLKAKEEEMCRQSQYFENFKTQLQHKLSLARDREQSLQSRIYALEKQLLDMSVSAATGMATISTVRITARNVTCWEEQERLPPMRGEGEGEEERKEERKKQWQPSVANEREGGQVVDEGKTDKEIQGETVKVTKQNSNEARLQGFILSLQEDLRVLLEREEDGMTERRGLAEQLQEAQENSHFLGCRVEEMKAEVQQLKLSESSLMEEVEELREENNRLQQILQDAANQTTSQSSTVPESAVGHSSAGCSGEVLLASDEGIHPHSCAAPPAHHQVTAESAHSIKEDHSLSAKSESPSKNDPLDLLCNLDSRTSPSVLSLSLTTETLGEFTPGTWCSRGILNLEESPSEESDALREAYRSLGLGEDLEALQKQRDRLVVALQHSQEQLQVMAQENTRLKLQLRKEVEERDVETEQESSREQNSTLPTSDGDDAILALSQDDLVQALNQENRALADRIQELLAHIELREEEMKRVETQLREHISKIETERVGLEQENQEQVCLITELTKKTEDDLNTIMELQQRFEESKQHMEESQVNKESCGSQMQSECAAVMSGSFPQNSLAKCVDSLVESVLKGEEPQLTSSQPPDIQTTVSEAGSQCDLQNSLQNSLHVSSLTDQVAQLTKSVQSLKTEQEEQSVCIRSLREQQREVTLSVQTQTEVKQQLTRTVWGLKEEKDAVSRSLADLRQEREQLTRTVCGLKDERDQFIRSMSGLKEEKDQLTKSVSSLERETEKLLETLSSGKEESDQIKRSLQSLKTDSDQLNQAVLSLKQERDELTKTLKSLKEQRDEEQSSRALQEGQLIKSVSSLREEKHSIRCLKQEEKQIKVLIQGQREQRDSLRTDGRNQDLLNPNTAVTTETAENLVGIQEKERCQTSDHRGLCAQQGDLIRDIEALSAELKRSKEELDKSHVDAKRLLSELCQSEARKEEAEAKVVRLTDEANQMEETRRDNASLITQVKELQMKLTGLVREKTDALSLKAQLEEQHNILKAQLNAKTVALQELNSEYIALKQERGSADDLSTVVISLRTRYNDIRAKYDALLKRKSQNDLDITPLKAKVSCLVVKCQERNSLLVQMMKAMNRRGGADSTLMQQVEQLLSDPALQDYTATFTPGSNVKTSHFRTGFTPEFMSTFQDYTNGFTPDQTCCVTPSLINQQCQNEFTPIVEKGGKLTSSVTTEPRSDYKDCSSDVTPAPTGTLKKNAISPVPDSPVQEHGVVQATPSPVVPALTETLITDAVKLYPSACEPEKSGFHHPDKKGKFSPDLSRLTGSSPSPPHPSSAGTRVSPSRRLSSPEKIINLHEQLQKTLMSSYQTPVSRGRGQQPKKSLSFPAPADVASSAFQTKSFSKPLSASLPVSTASSQAKHTPAVTTTPVATNKSKALFNAVTSRSANVTFSPNKLTHHHSKADMFTTTSALSGSSNFPFAATSKSTCSSGTNSTISPELTEKITAIHDTSDAKHTAPLTLRTNTFDSDVLIYSDTNPRTTASDTTAPSISAAPTANHFNTPSNTNGAAPTYDGLIFAASHTQSVCRSPERSSKSATKTAAALEKTKTARPKPEAPAEVRSVDVIKTVGQSNLLIGWERPPLDELGCSNGTFVYGYRVFVDGDFHKSVMSSACTKCVLENIDLSVPVHISVQTLGSNGLSSHSVHTTYRNSVRTDHR